jgi:membrane protein
VSRFDLRRLRSRDEFLATGRQLLAEIRNDDIPSLAAAVAFKIVLALFPSMVAAVGIFSLVTDPTDLKRILGGLDEVAPAAVDFLEPPLTRLINSRGAGLAAVIGIAGGVWAASGAAATLNKSLSRAYDVVDERKLVAARAAALAVTIALVLALVGMFLLLVVGGSIQNRVLDSLPLTATASNVIGLIVSVVRNLLAAVALMLLFAFIYWVGPDVRHHASYVWISPGAALGVVTWLVASGLFGVYVNTFGNFTSSGSIYGSLGSAIVFMLWLQLSIQALLLGAEVNQVLLLRAGRRSATADIAGFGGEPVAQLALEPESAPESAAESAAGGDGEGESPAEGDRVGEAAPGGGRGRPETTHRAVDDRTHGNPPPRGRSRRPPLIGAGGALLAGISGLLGLVGLLRYRRRG